MAHLDAYLFFDGKCAEAMRFYEAALGGKLEMMMTYDESPAGSDAPPGAGDRIMHARLDVEGRSLMASDFPTSQTHQGMHGFALSMNYQTVDEARRVFDRLAEGGTVSMPLEATFWAEAFGMLTDRFGTPWMINVDKPREE
jgi:PhnB protein